MPLPPPILPAKRRVRRKRRGGSAPVVAGPVLVSAMYTPTLLRVVLGFDRAVDIGAFDGSAVIVNDPVTQEARFHATGGAALLGPATVEVVLNHAGAMSGTVTRLTATAAAGIVAADGGAAWAGVSELPLPFPAA